MANVITGTTNDDFLIGSDEKDIINGLAGDDQIRIWAGDDFVYGGQGNDTIISQGGGTKFLYGNTGNDFFNVFANMSDDLVMANVTIVGEDGNDAVLANITSNGPTLNDSIIVFDGGIGQDTLTATLMNADVIFNGGDNNDLLQVNATGTYAILIDGGAGDDVFDINALGTYDISFSADDPGTDTLIWRNGNLAIFPLGFENIIFSVSVHGAAATANSKNNIITGSAFNDTLNALAGNDTLDGGAGGDTLNGGADFDTVTYATSSVGVTINLAGNLGVGGTAAGDRIFECERLIGSNFGDSLGGGTIDSTIYGLAGNDTIDGGIGNNVINGGAGADNLVGREGNDTFWISGAEGVGDTMVGGIGTDTLRVIGTGDITLSGFNAGTTSIEQWLGNNKGVIGTAAADVFNFAALTSETGLLFIDGAGGNDTILASNLADDLRGSAGNDTLNGGSGNDTVSGGLGNDVLTGGAGNDYFVFSTAPNASANRDSISDFAAINDTIRLENAVFNGLGSTTGTLSSAKFWASATGLAHDADDRIIYNTTTGVLTYDANGNGTGGAIAFATLTAKPTITAADFVVI